MINLERYYHLEQQYLYGMKAAIIVKEDGLLYVNQVPDKPKICFDPNSCVSSFGICDCEIKLGTYQQELASAKDSAILCQDHEQVRELLFVKYCIFPKEIALKQAAGIYPIEGLEWDVFEKEFGTGMKTFAILKPSKI